MSKTIPLLCTHVYSYMFSTEYPRSCRGELVVGLEIVGRHIIGGTCALWNGANRHSIRQWEINYDLSGN